MVWGGGLEDTIPEAHPTDQYSAHHRVPGEPCSFLYHQPGCWHPFVSLVNPHSSPPCYRAIFNVCVPILSPPPISTRCMDRAWARNYFYICASRSVHAC